MPQKPGSKQVLVGTVREAYLSSAQGLMSQIVENALPAIRTANNAKSPRTASGGTSLGIGGLPSGAALPATLATGSPLSILQYSLSRADRIAMYRYFSRSDPFVARALELHSELPLSRLTIGPPRGPNAQQNREINRIYESMVERLGVLEFLLEVAREYWLAGDVYCWHEWEPESLEWKEIYTLPLEYCNKAGSLVTLSDGTKEPIENIKVGDWVVSHQGNLCRVKEIFSREVKEEIYHLKASGNSMIAEVTGDHPYYVHRKGRKKGHFEWVKVKDLKSGDSVLYRVPIEVRPNPWSDRHCWLLGLILADGYVGNDFSHVAICFGLHELDKAEACKKELGVLFPPEFGAGNLKNTLIYPRLSPPHRGEVVVRYYNKSLVRFCAGIGHEAKNKRVPEWALYASDSQIRAILQGIRQGDGHENKRKDWVLNSASPQLIQDVRWLWSRLGAWTRDQASIAGKGFPWKVVLTDSQKSTRERQKMFSMTVPANYVHVMEGPRKHFIGSYQSGPGWSLHRVSVKEKGYEEVTVYHLSVEEDESYHVDNMAVHNCHSVPFPFNRNKEIIIFARPLVDTASIRRMTDRDLYQICCHPSTLIQMASGRQEFIRELKKGDEVLSGDGNIREVKAVFRKMYHGNLVKVKLRNNSEPLRLTPGHVVHSNRGKIPVEQLRKDDKLYFRPNHEEIENTSLSDGKVFLAGWFVAEGFLRKSSENTRGDVFFCLNLNDEKLVAEEIKKLLVSEFPPEHHGGRREGNSNKDYKQLLLSQRATPIEYRKYVLSNEELAYSCVICNAPVQYLSFFTDAKQRRVVCCKVCKSFRTFPLIISLPRIYEDPSASELKIYYKNQAAYEFFQQFSPVRGAEGKSIPDSWMFLPKKQQQIFWNAYHEGDGHQQVRGGERSSTTSPDLRDKLYILASRIGWNCRKEVRDKEEGVRANSSLVIREEQARFFTKNRQLGEKPKYFLYTSKSTQDGKQGVYDIEDGNLLLEVEEISEESYEGFVYNILVDEDHTYHANGIAVNNSGDPDIQKLLDEMEEELPEGLKSLLDYNEGHPLNTDPSKGSFCYHITRNRTPGEPYGQGLLERCLETLLRLENLKNAQLQITGRNMNPKHLIWGEGIGPDELAELRAQVDLSLIEGIDYPVVTNYQVNWTTVGPDQRLLNVTDEYSILYESLSVGLCTTRELLTGAATYGAQRISLEIQNTQYLWFRELMKNYVELSLFRPVAEAKGHYYYEEIDTWVSIDPEDIEVGDDIVQEYDGQLRKRMVQVNKVYNHSKLRFNRLSIRDNSEVYEQLFQLHQKGSLALRYLLDIHNIDPEENAAALLEDLGTVRDPTFNRLLEGVYQALSEPIATSTNLFDKLVEGMNLDVQSQAQGEPSPGQGPEVAGGFGIPSMGSDIITPSPALPGDMNATPDLNGVPGDLDQNPGIPTTPGTPTPGTPTAPAGNMPTSAKKRGKPALEAFLGTPLKKHQIQNIIREVEKSNLSGAKLTKNRLLKVTGAFSGSKLVKSRRG